ARNSPLEPVSSWWAKMRVEVGGAYEYLWWGWANANAVDMDLDEEVNLGQASPVACVSLSMESGD
ncbi:hypothetical protein KI387_041727, partial [Taxus chinensis]